MILTLPADAGGTTLARYSTLALHSVTTAVARSARATSADFGIWYRSRAWAVKLYEMPVSR